VVRLREGARTYSYAYRAIYMGTSPSIYKGGASRCKVYIYRNFFNISRSWTYIFPFFIVLVFS